MPRAISRKAIGASVSAMASRSSAATAAPTVLSSPKLKTSEAVKVFMGELKPKSPEAAAANLKLEAALEQWRRAAEGQGWLRSDQ